VRIIFSRKGFDSASGGCPSPVIDGRPLSLPIPTRQPSGITFADLHGPYASLVADLTRGRQGADSRCHLDPDIDHSLLPRQPGWRGAFGQAGAALSHLEGQGVGPGDLFLFWGSFRDVECHAGRWRFTGPTRHTIFAWLQVESAHRLDPLGPTSLAARHPWLTLHPHMQPGWSGANAIYVAAPSLTLPGQETTLPGWGVLRRGHVLTAAGGVPSRWSVPPWLHPAAGGTGMTYHPPSRWSCDGTVRCVGRGQEFVAHPHNPAEAARWVRGILEETP
jgi:hypothetical protein